MSKMKGDGLDLEDLLSQLRLRKSLPGRPLAGNAESGCFGPKGRTRPRSQQRGEDQRALLPLFWGLLEDPVIAPAFIVDPDSKMKFRQSLAKALRTVGRSRRRVARRLMIKITSLAITDLVSLVLAAWLPQSFTSGDLDQLSKEQLWAHNSLRLLIDYGPFAADFIEAKTAAERKEAVETFLVKKSSPDGEI